MSKQIAIRLPDELVDFLDGLVAEGAAASRAQVVARALAHEQRRRAAERDALIYSRIEKADDDLDALAAWAAKQPLDLD